jgi:hypothetical protein
MLDLPSSVGFYMALVEVVAISAIFQTIPPDLLHGLFLFAQCHEQAHLFLCSLLADLRHRKSNVDQNPIAELRHVVLEKPQLDFAANSGDLNHANVMLALNKFDKFSWNG